MATSVLKRSEWISENSIAKVLLGMAMLTLFSKLSIPLKPVPITLQSIMVLLIGLRYTPKEAISTTGSWLLAGQFFPVFSDNITVGFLGSVKAGYFVGMLLASYLMALVRQAVQSSSILFETINCAFGLAIIFLLGVSWLATSIGLAKAIAYGFLPFIIPGVIKSAVLISILKCIKK